MDNYTASIVVTEPFVLGDTYLVTWDGTDYECVARDVDGGVMIGNDNLFGYSGAHEEPFAMYTEGTSTQSGDSEAYTLNIFTQSERASHTVAIRHIAVAIRPLGAEYLPKVYLNGTEAMSLIDALNYLCVGLSQALGSASVPHFTEEQTVYQGSNSREAQLQ